MCLFHLDKISIYWPDTVFPSLSLPVSDLVTLSGIIHLIFSVDVMWVSITIWVIIKKVYEKGIMIR